MSSLFSYESHAEVPRCICDDQEKYDCPHREGMLCDRADGVDWWHCVTVLTILAGIGAFWWGAIALVRWLSS